MNKFEKDVVQQFLKPSFLSLAICFLWYSATCLTATNMTTWFAMARTTDKLSAHYYWTDIFKNSTFGSHNHHHDLLSISPSRYINVTDNDPLRQAHERSTNSIRSANKKFHYKKLKQQHHQQVKKEKMILDSNQPSLHSTTTRNGQWALKRYTIESPFHPRIARVDEIKVDKKKEQRSSSLWNWLLTSSQVNDTSKGKLSETAFEIMVHCQTDDKQVCRHIETDSNRIAKLIADEALDIYEPITVKMVIRNFCPNSNKNCELSNTIAQAAPTVLYPGHYEGESEDKPLLFSQSLVKQLDLNIDFAYYPYDIMVEVNADSDLWFESSGKQIDSKEADFQTTFAHELTHGLGFISGWQHLGELFGGEAKYDEYLVPPLDYEGADGSSTSPEKRVVRDWLPLTIFDRQLKHVIYLEDDGTQNKVDNGTVQETLTNSTKQTENLDLYPLYEQISNFSVHSEKVTKFVKKFKKSGAPYEAATTMFRIMTIYNGVAYETESAGSLGLFTPSRFAPASSIAHVDRELWNTPEFLMVPAAMDFLGRTIHDIIRDVTKNGTEKIYGVYGQKTLNVLSTMGYPTVNSPQRKTLHLTPISESFAIPHSLKGTHWILMILMMMTYFCFTI